jgi:hypothetical protein
MQYNHCKQIGHVKRYCPHLPSANGCELVRQRKSDERYAGVSETPQVIVTTKEHRAPVEELHAASDSGITRSWVLDSAAAAHITKDISLLDDRRPTPGSTRGCDDENAKINYMGTVTITPRR